MVNEYSIVEKNFITLYVQPWEKLSIKDERWEENNEEWTICMHNHALLIPKDTEGNNWERELKNQMILKFDWQCKYFFFHILLTVNKMQTKVTVIGHKNTMLHNLCPIRERNWSTESTCLKSLQRACQVNFHVQLKTKYFFLFFYLIILFKP